MKQQRSRSWNRVAAVFGVVMAVAGMAAPARAALVTLTSADFSRGYGFTASWTTAEITATLPGTPARTVADFAAGAPYSAASNTATTLGSFSLVPTVSSASFASGGPKFDNRVLAGGSAGSDQVGRTDSFSLSVVATYLAALPPGAYNPQITFNITDISIWAFKWTSLGTTTVNWNETTAGHTSSSSAVTLNAGTDVRALALYKQVLWNPADFTVAGTSSTRPLPSDPAAT